MKIGFGCRIFRDHADRHGKNDAVSDTRVLAIANHRGAVVQEDAKQRDGLRLSGRGEHRERQRDQNEQDSAAHEGFQSNGPVEFSQEANTDVEKLLMKGEFPVEYTTRENIFVRIVQESSCR